MTDVVWPKMPDLALISRVLLDRSKCPHSSDAIILPIEVHLPHFLTSGIFTAIDQYNWLGGNRCLLNKARILSGCKSFGDIVEILYRL